MSRRRPAWWAYMEPDERETVLRHDAVRAQLATLTKEKRLIYFRCVQRRRRGRKPSGRSR
jgi:hypothetical protein